MIIYRIHFQHQDRFGVLTDDAVMVSGETIVEVRVKARAEVEKRKGINPWSEEVKS